MTFNYNSKFKILVGEYEIMFFLFLSFSFS